MTIEEVNENSSAYLTVSFYDKTGVLAAPNTASYRIDCKTNDQEVKDDTALAAASSVEIHLNASNNAIITATNRQERKVVTVTAVYGVDDQIVDEYEYNVINLKYEP